MFALLYQTWHSVDVDNGDGRTIELLQRRQWLGSVDIERYVSLHLMLMPCVSSKEQETLEEEIWCLDVSTGLREISQYPEKAFNNLIHINTLKVNGCFNKVRRCGIGISTNLSTNALLALCHCKVLLTPLCRRCVVVAARWSLAGDVWLLFWSLLITECQCGTPSALYCSVVTDVSRLESDYCHSQDLCLLFYLFIWK